MNTFTITEKTLAGLPSMTITKAEVEAISQVFGLRVLDWRRFTDQEASDWFAASLNRYGADHIFAALTRVRRLSGRERGFFLTSIAVVDPRKAHLMKNPPDATDDEVWRLAFGVFLVDEMDKTRQRLDAQAMEAALQEQL